MLKKIIDFIKELIRKMRKDLGFACLCLILLSVDSFCMSTYVTKAMTISTTETQTVTATVNVSKVKDLTIYVNYDEAGTAAATLAIYGTNDDGTTKYAMGVNPLLTGTRDSDASIDFTADSTVGYEIVGIAKTLYLSWVSTLSTGTIEAQVYVIGKEW